MQAVPQVFVAGVNVGALAPVADLVISHEFPPNGIGGPVTADFTIQLPAAKRPSWLVKGAPAEVRLGGWPMLAGALLEPDWSDGSLSIAAAANEGSTTACLTAAGTTTNTADVAVDAAIARSAITWSRPGSISATPLSASGDETADLNPLSDLLGDVAEVLGARLYVDASRRLLKTIDPTAPEVFVLPGAGELAWTTEAQATRVIGRWQDATGNRFTTMVGTGAIEQMVDLTVMDAMTVTSATALLSNILARASAGGWANGLTLAAEQLIGTPHLADVADRVGRGLMIRNLGQIDPRGDRLPVGYVDVVIERSEWHVDDRQIILTPRGMVARDWATVLAEAGVKEAA